jgi:hypothetical protein
MKNGCDYRRVVGCEYPPFPIIINFLNVPSYLDEITRITAKKYIPTDGLCSWCYSRGGFINMSPADVLKARLKTTGVVEHTFVINTGHNKGVHWRIYDVGGARSQRQAWAPYFDDGEYLPMSAPCGIS